VVVGMRLFAWDTWEPFAVLNELTLFVYLPAWIIGIVAIIWWRPFLAVGAILIVAAQIVLLLPELTAAQPVPSWVGRAPSLRLLDANVYYLNSSMSGYATEIKAVRPDLVTMEEATPIQVKRLVAAGGLSGLPHRLVIKRWDPKAFLVASTYPLSSDNVVYYGHVPLIVQTTLHLPSGLQELWVVHTTAPLPGEGFSEWKGQLAEVVRLLRARGPGRLLLVGDFNADWGSRGFRSVLDTGMVDGAAARGRSLDMTWSQIMPVLPPLVRIDHVLTGPGLAVTRIATEDGPGSDHRDLVATVAIRPSPGGSQ
jgi:endonuclease/exonuclease/phosphatase (EEP) superfamily protein YafD